MTDLPWPFIGAEALAARAIPERVMRALYQPIYPGVFVPWGIDPTAVERARAAWLWSKRTGVVAGQSAAAVLGAKWVDGAAPAELIHDNFRPPPELIVRCEASCPAEVVTVDGVAVTSPERTVFDVGRHTASRVHVVQRLDALINATDVKTLDVQAVMAAHPGARGLPRLRRALALVDGGAESPQETVARLALIDAGLPAPRTQVNVYGDYGEFIARLEIDTSR